MRPWICVAYSAPVAAATAVFLIYPIGQGSFSDGEMAAVNSFRKKSCLKKGTSVLKASKNNSNSPNNNADLTVGKLLGLDDVEGFPNTLPIGIRGFNKKTLADNPLRNSILNIPLKQILLSQDNDNNMILTNSKGLQAPGIYIIYNPREDRFWVGESENIYERLRKHFSELRSGRSENTKMNLDYAKNSKEWEVYYYSNPLVPSLNTRPGRIPIESMIQRCCCLNRNIRLYNLQIQNPAERVQESRSGGSTASFRKLPGILEVRCLGNNKIWYSQTNNLSQKRSQVLQKLRRGEQSINQSLYNDWMTYGETNFTFRMVYCGIEYSDPTLRANLLRELVEKTPIELQYNTKISGVRLFD
jgi:hypothetical protein